MGRDNSCRADDASLEFPSCRTLSWWACKPRALEFLRLREGKQQKTAALQDAGAQLTASGWRYKLPCEALACFTTSAVTPSKLLLAYRR